MGGSLYAWDTFGNSIGNVSADDSLAKDGTHALKMFGQFNGSENFSGISQGVAISGGEALRAEASTRTPSWDTLVGKSNEVTMKVEFYSEFGSAYDSPEFLGEETLLIHDGSSAADFWFDHSLEVVAPDEAVEARLAFLFRQPGTDNGAIWIDSAELFVQTISDGDFDFDNDADGPDFLNWQGDTSIGSLTAWEASYGTSAAQVSSAAVPEPASCVLVATFLFLAAGWRLSPVGT